MGVEGDIATYLCPEKEATRQGQFNTTLICQSGEWLPDVQFLDMDHLIDVFSCNPGEKIYFYCSCIWLNLNRLERFNICTVY